MSIPIVLKPMTTPQDFWKMVCVRTADECWNWIGAGTRYGVCKWNGAVINTHRVAFAIARGPIPDGMHVCHTCDNPKCVNPDHLFLGSPSANQKDCISKGRRPFCAGNAILTANQVAEIKSLKGKFTASEIAAYFKVRIGTIHAIFCGKRWKHIEASKFHMETIPA